MSGYTQCYNMTKQDTTMGDMTFDQIPVGAIFYAAYLSPRDDTLVHDGNFFRSSYQYIKTAAKTGFNLQESKNTRFDGNHLVSKIDSIQIDRVYED